mmetsp:Transcript_1652/g.5786  ORF Transcript_1652/g.5786 Transcript_1652/m.5786 type:complete len:1264 (+) Transcript_1652:193-3984(+)
MRRSSSFDQLDEGEGTIVVGVCAMDKKSRSRPMANILRRLNRNYEFEIIVFGDHCILHEPVENWPTCDVLISFFSDGFPLQKCEEYVDLRKPYVVNDIKMQYLLQDRRKVYELLQQHNIPTPTFAIVHRTESGDEVEDFEEGEDFVSVNGVKIYKPFVEKPISGEDHRINVYYHSAVGGGMQALFRKEVDRSSNFFPEQTRVRRRHSYIYENFVTTEGTDVKVYTIGPDYAHAEARKAPVLDGVVHRDEDGKEKRYPVLLSPYEKEIARKVQLAFGQFVCGFDILRSADKKEVYVCDVNGWSLVKNSPKCWDDCAHLLRLMIFGQVNPRILGNFRGLSSKRFQSSSRTSIDCLSTSMGDDPAERGGGSGSLPGIKLCGTSASQDDLRKMEGNRPNEELRCVLAVVRHGDRTPKQKMKLRVCHPKLLMLMMKHLDAKGRQAKLKSAEQLQELLDVVRSLHDEYRQQQTQGLPADTEVADSMDKLGQIREVLEQGGKFSGINRKAQLKPLRHACHSPSADPQCNEGAVVVEEALLIMKWGGELTSKGRRQAEMVGRHFRQHIYPQYGPAGGGLLRLHATYRHDLKIYSSDEGRVQSSAAAFAKGLLDLETTGSDGASLIPILVSLVRKDPITLDTLGRTVGTEMADAKRMLYRVMMTDHPPGLFSFVEGAGASSDPLEPASGVGPGTSSAEGPTRAHLRTRPSDWESVKAMSSDEATANLPDSPVAAKDNAMRRGVNSDSSPEALVTARQLCFVEMRAAVNDHFIATQQLTQLNKPSICPVPLPAYTRTKLFKLHELLKELTVLLEECAREQDHLREVREEQPPDEQLDSDRSSGWTGTAGDEVFEMDTGEGGLPPRSRLATPAEGESIGLMLSRWKKLESSLYNERKDSWDISKVPDIYDCAKYDMTHNSHIDLPIMPEVYSVSRELADGVVPNEYGLTCGEKVAIGAKIASKLVGKLLSDFANTREESVEAEKSGTRLSLFSHKLTPALNPQLQETQQPHAVKPPEPGQSEGEEDVLEDHMQTRLNTAYTTEINSPSRHVRSRLYFTSESHIHSLMNVLRLCHLRQVDTTVSTPTKATRASPPPDAANSPFTGSGSSISADDTSSPLLDSEALKTLAGWPELDYLSHVVFRMFEVMDADVTSPERFRIEILFSPGVPTRKQTDALCDPAKAPEQAREYVPSECRSDNDAIDDTMALDERMGSLPVEGLKLLRSSFDDVQDGKIVQYLTLAKTHQMLKRYASTRRYGHPGGRQIGELSGSDRGN